jgi:hypothetical protein
LTLEERAARIIFLRHHLVGLKEERAQKGLSEEARVILETEMGWVDKALDKLDPMGIFPP